jgi:hypothetical protein
VFAGANAISISDVDIAPGGAENFTVTLSTNNGANDTGMVHVVDTIPGVTITGNDTGAVILNGSIDDINLALDGMTFIPYAEGYTYSGTSNALLKILTNDNRNIYQPPNSAAALTDTDTITFTVNAVPDTPVNTVNPIGVPQGTSQVNFNGALSVHDGDPGETLMVQVMAGDGFSGISLNGGTPLPAFYLVGTESYLNPILAGLKGDLIPGFTGTPTIDITTTDSTGLFDHDILAVTLDAPSGLSLVSPGTIIEDAGQVSLGSAVSITDPDSSSVTIDLVAGPGSGFDVLNATASGLAVVTGDGTSSLQIQGSVTDINNTLATLSGALTPNFNGTATVNVALTDGVSNVNGVLSAEVLAVNDAPVNTVPISQPVTVGTPLVFSSATGNAISVSDVDALEGSGQLGVTLSVTPGTGVLTLNGTTGLTIIGGADGTDTMTFVGTEVDINSALDGMSFTPDPSYGGSANVNIATSDMGNFPAPGQVDTDMVALDLSGVNDAPVNIVPIAVQQADPSGAVIFNAGNNNLISISDVDAGAGLLQVTLTATNGTMTLSGVTGLTFDPGQDGTADATMSFSGTLADINNALDGMSFNRDAGYIGLADVTINVNDQGNTGSGGPQVATAVANISVEPYDTWFAGFGTEAGWEVYNYPADGCSYYTHDYALYWQFVDASATWNFYNGTAWVPTDALGNAPYDGGYGPPNEWFDETTGTYAGYDVYIHTAGQATYFSLDFAAPGATFWQLTDAGAWSYWDGDSWDPTGGFLVEPVNVWFHGYDGTDAGWDVYNDSANGDEYFTQNMTVFWWHVATGDTWQYWNGTAWVPTTGPQGVVPV